MYRILLINPPREHLVRLDTRGFVDLGELSSFPPIGLMYLAQALRQRSSDFEVRILDAVAGRLSARDIAGVATEFSPNIIGITAFTYTFYDVWQTARELKSAMPEVPIAVGGPHMYVFAPETMVHRCFDYGVVGDGEEVFADLCEALSRKQEVTPLSGLLFRRGSEVCGEGAAELTQLDAVPIPAIDLVDPFAYYNTVGRGSAVGAICTSRGCPFRCTFCQVPRRKYRIRSVQSVVDEIEVYMRLGITDFFFFDDLFNVSRSRVQSFSEEVLRRKLRIGWMFRGRVDQMDEAMLRLARRAGCHTISVGIEDSTDSGLRAIKKNITLRGATEAVRLIRRCGIRCSTNWIIGFPHQRSLKDLQHLLDTAIEMDADYAQFSVLQCLPGSELYDQAVAEGGIDGDAWRNYVLNPSEQFSPPLWEKFLTKAEMFGFYEGAYSRYYLRPKMVWREILRTRSLAEAAYKFKAVKAVFWDKRRASKLATKAD